VSVLLVVFALNFLNLYLYYGDEAQGSWDPIGLLLFVLVLIAGFAAWVWLPAVDAGKWTARLVLGHYGVICLWWVLFNALFLLYEPIGSFADDALGERLEAMAYSLAAGPWTALYYIGSLDFAIVVVLMLIMIAVGLRWSNLRFTRICGYVGVCIWFFLGMAFVF